MLSHSVVSDSLQLPGLQPTRLLCPWDSPGKNTDVGSLSLLQGIFLTQELNRGLLNCRQILSQLSHKGSPNMDSRVRKGPPEEMACEEKSSSVKERTIPERGNSSVKALKQ